MFFPRIGRHFLFPEIFSGQPGNIVRDWQRYPERATGCAFGVEGECGWRGIAETGTARTRARTAIGRTFGGYCPVNAPVAYEVYLTRSRPENQRHAPSTSKNLAP